MADLEKYGRSLASFYGISTRVIADKRGMSREDWLRQRKLGIGGSDIGKILGVSSFGTALDVWADKCEVIEEEFSDEQLEAMQSGNDMEDLILELYRKKTGRKVVQINAMCGHPDIPWSQVNVDAICQREDGTWGVLEVKNTLARGEEWKKGEVPEAYKYQCYYGMMCLNLKWGEVISLRSGRWTKESIHTLEWDDSIGAKIFESGDAFWKCVQEKEAPKYDGKADGGLWKDTLMKLVAEQHSKPREILGDETDSDRVYRYLSLKAELKDKEAEIDGLQAYFAEKLQGEGSLNTGNGCVTWKKAAGRRTFDSKRFEKDNPDLAAAYFTVGEPSMRMTVK